MFPQKREFFAYGKPYCRTCGQRHLSERHERARQQRRELLAQPTRTCSTCRKELPNTEAHFNMRQSGSMCKPCRLAAGRQWSRSNPEHVRAKQSQRRAKKVQAGGTHTPADVRQQLQAQKGLCYWCRTRLQTTGENKYHVDHLIALAKGGSNGPENIVCACPDCNLHKSDKMPWEFAGRLL